MRTAFIEALADICEQDTNVVLLTGDLGFGVLNDFRRRFPGQFFNVGVAEQNLAGVAAGMAMTGHKVLTYSIGNFPTLRCLEQVRSDICYHQAEVTVVTVGGGMSYGALGPSHFATEDLAIMRALPGMTVVAPGDPWEVKQLLPQILERPGPAYLRLGRDGEPRVLPGGAEVKLGVPTRARQGEDGLLLTTGAMLEPALRVAERLDRSGMRLAVRSVHTLSPLDEGAVAGLVGRAPFVITCEEHTTRGGLGGAVAEVMAECGIRTPFKRFGLPPRFPRGVGSQEYLRAVNGISPDDLERLATAMAGGNKGSSGKGSTNGPGA